MFLKYTKIFFAKRMLSKSFLSANNVNCSEPIKTIGIIVDESCFFEKENLLKLISDKGIKIENIEILVYKDKIKKKEVINYPSFSKNDVSCLATIENTSAKDFNAKKFDMLISYYDVNKTPLIIVTHLSLAKFKVGFALADKRLNHFMINTNVQNYKVFVDELFRYLKILNKI